MRAFRGDRLSSRPASARPARQPTSSTRAPSTGSRRRPAGARSAGTTATVRCGPRDSRTRRRSRRARRERARRRRRRLRPVAPRSRGSPPRPPYSLSAADRRPLARAKSLSRSASRCGSGGWFDKRRLAMGVGAYADDTRRLPGEHRPVSVASDFFDEAQGGYELSYPGDGRRGRRRRAAPGDPPPATRDPQDRRRAGGAERELPEPDRAREGERERRVADTHRRSARRARRRPVRSACRSRRSARALARAQTDAPVRERCAQVPAHAAAAREPRGLHRRDRIRAARPATSRTRTATPRSSWSSCAGRPAAARRAAVRAEEGDSIAYLSSTPHRVANTGDDIAEVMWIISPPSY